MLNVTVKGYFRSLYSCQHPPAFLLEAGFVLTLKQRVFDMNINSKFLLIGTSLSLIPALTYAQCAATDCLQLGYTSLKKCDNGLKCPFGEYWACPKVEEKAVLGQCTGYAKNCAIGQILNSDGTCTSDVISGKSPLGVVVAIKDNCGYAMTASPIAINIKWSSLENVSTGIGEEAYWQKAITNFDACINTQKIIQQGNSSEYPAAWAAVNYTPSAAPATKGKWCLPAPGMLNSLYINLNTINNTIFNIGGTQFINDSEHIWSSSEAGFSAWHFCVGSGADMGGVDTSIKYRGNVDNVVRPVIEF